MKKALIPITLTIAFLSSAIAQDVTWCVKEVGNDLTITATGSIHLSSISATGPLTFTEIGEIGEDQLAGKNGTALYFANDVFTSTGWLTGISFDDTASVSGETFGTVDNFFYWDSSYGANPSVITPDTVLTFKDQTIAGMFGTSLDDGLRHTIYNQSSSSGSGSIGIKICAVPEPSSTALLGLGALGLIIRRKR